MVPQYAEIAAGLQQPFFLSSAQRLGLRSEREDARPEIGHLFERLIPPSLEFAHHEAVLGIGRIKLPLRPSRLIPGLLQRQFNGVTFRLVLVKRPLPSRPGPPAGRRSGSRRGPSRPRPGPHAHSRPRGRLRSPQTAGSRPPRLHDHPRRRRRARERAGSRALREGTRRRLRGTRRDELLLDEAAQALTLTIAQARSLGTKGLEVIVHDLVERTLRGIAAVRSSSRGRPLETRRRAPCQRGTGRNRPECDGARAAGRRDFAVLRRWRHRRSCPRGTMKSPRKAAVAVVMSPTSRSVSARELGAVEERAGVENVAKGRVRRSPL